MRQACAPELVVARCRISVNQRYHERPFRRPLRCQCHFGRGEVSGMADESGQGNLIMLRERTGFRHKTPHSLCRRGFVSCILNIALGGDLTLYSQLQARN